MSVACSYHTAGMRQQQEFPLRKRTSTLIRKLLKEYFQALPEEIKNPPVDDTCDLSVKPDDMGQVFDEILSLCPIRGRKSGTTP